MSAILADDDVMLTIKPGEVSSGLRNSYHHRVHLLKDICSTGNILDACVGSLLLPVLQGITEVVIHIAQGLKGRG